MCFGHMYLVCNSTLGEWNLSHTCVYGLLLMPIYLLKFLPLSLNPCMGTWHHCRHRLSKLPNKECFQPVLIHHPAWWRADRSLCMRQYGGGCELPWHTSLQCLYSRRWHSGQLCLASGMHILPCLESIPTGEEEEERRKRREGGGERGREGRR